MFDTAVLLYKNRNEQVPIKTPVMFQNFEVNHRLVALGGYTLPRYARNFGQRSITYQGMKLWNTLPNEIKQLSSWATPRDSHVLTAGGGVGFSPNFLCPVAGVLN